MPVDPSNLLLLGRVGAVPVIGMPGCAHSIRLNGFDWILARLVTDISVTSADIAAMGVGGLLEEILAQVMPREMAVSQADVELRTAAHGARKIAVIVLAAGRSNRMGQANKLLAAIDGKPVVRHVVETALVSIAASVVVVTGRQTEAVEAALSGLKLTVARNQNYALGLSASLRRASRPWTPLARARSFAWPTCARSRWTMPGPSGTWTGRRTSRRRALEASSTRSWDI